MSTWLLDVNSLLACGWRTHADHSGMLNWLMRVGDWATCPITESGFVRISMTVAYQASFENARQSLSSLRALPGHRFIKDDVDAASLPLLTSHKEVTDGHLVSLAKRHGFKIATLDAALIKKAWATGIAENPLQPPAPAHSAVSK